MSMSSEHTPVPEHQRLYYRHKDTGDLGYLVQVDGRPKIRLDRPNQVMLRPFSDQVWVPDDTARTLQPMQKATVAFMADKQLCLVLGLASEAKRDWTRMRDSERIEWLRNGPRKVNDPTVNAVRDHLFAAIMGVMERLS